MSSFTLLELAKLDPELKLEYLTQVPILFQTYLSIQVVQISFSYRVHVQASFKFSIEQ